MKPDLQNHHPSFTDFSRQDPAISGSRYPSDFDQRIHFDSTPALRRRLRACLRKEFLSVYNERLGEQGNQRLEAVWNDLLLSARICEDGTCQWLDAYRDGMCSDQMNSKQSFACSD